MLGDFPRFPLDLFALERWTGPSGGKTGNHPNEDIRAWSTVAGIGGLPRVHVCRRARVPCIRHFGTLRGGDKRFSLVVEVVDAGRAKSGILDQGPRSADLSRHLVASNTEFAVISTFYACTPSPLRPSLHPPPRLRITQLPPPPLSHSKNLTVLPTTSHHHSHHTLLLKLRCAYSSYPRHPLKI